MTVKNHSKTCLIISACIMALAVILSLCGLGINYGIDFTGGTTIQVEMGKEVPIEDVEKSLEVYELNPQIIYAGEGNTQIVIKTIKSLDNAARGEIIDTLGTDFGITQEDVLASEQFGPSVGNEL